MNRGKVYILRDGGFSLVEMLVAIAVMAVLGTVILQVFLAADKMNDRAATLDKAVNLTVDAVERLKAENPATVWNRETLVRIFPESGIEEEGEGWRIRVLFDAQWQAFSRVRADWPAHHLQLDLQPNPETGGRTTTVHAFVADSGENGQSGKVADGHDEALFSMNTADGQEEVLFSMDAELPSTCEGQGVSP